MSQSVNLPSIYNPANMTRENLLKSFVIRKKQFEEIYEDIRNSDMMYPAQHYIIQGQRGSGKTTLLWRLFYEVKNDENINNWLIPVILSEEQFQIDSLHGFWEEIAKHLESIDNFSEISKEMDAMWDKNIDFERSCFNILEVYLLKNSKKIIIFIDNFGVMLDKFSLEDQQRLKEVLIACSEIRIIGASAVAMETTYIYSKPFFDFFSIIRLESLSENETIQLLLSLGTIYKQDEVKKLIRENSGKIEAMRRLTGGVPRTIVLLFEIFVDSTEGDSFKNLENLLDRVTPLYKHRMEDLPIQQQKIVYEIAMNWDAISVKEISNKVRMKSKAVSAQLSLLVKSDLVLKIKTDTKNHLYMLNERFFNIWFLMRYGRKKDINKIKWLVQFLELWCNPNELESRAKMHLRFIKEGKTYEKHALYMTQALAETNIPYKLKTDLISDTRNYLKKAAPSLLDELPRQETMSANKNLNLLDSSEYIKFEKDLKLDIDNGDMKAVTLLAFLYFETAKNKKEALVYIQEVYDKEKNIYNAHTYASILLWNNQIEEAMNVSEVFLKNEESHEICTQDVYEYFILLLAKKQYNYLLQQFKENKFDLKDRYKPIYYALMKLLKKEYPNEYIKAGSDLTETIDEIIKKVDEYEKKYK